MRMVFIDFEAGEITPEFASTAQTIVRCSSWQNAGDSPSAK